MNIFKQVFHLLRTGSDTGRYYESMNYALKEINDEYTMLHYPLFVNREDSFYQAQINLTDYCMRQLGPVHGKRILEIGCGNGIQSMYIYKKHHPAALTGIDLNKTNIALANSIKQAGRYPNLCFLTDDAHQLKEIEDNTFDLVLNIESAFHYPDKQSFLEQVRRIMKPDGKFLIADILTTRRKPAFFRRFWKKKMILHHWNASQYFNGFTNAKLMLEKNHDITQEVIKGFRNYKTWLKQMKKKPLLKRWALKIFYVINIRLNIYLLLTKRRYLVYVGTKTG